ncbi:MAG: hypothetical protein QXX12_00665 [Nanopusillaceae archaeon]
MSRAPRQIIQIGSIEQYLIERYVIPLLDESVPLSKKNARVNVLVTIVRNILMRTPIYKYIFDSIKHEVQYYNQLGYGLEEFSGTSLVDVFSWYNRNVAKKEGETDTKWIKRVAVVSNIILSHILVQRLPREIEIPIEASE